MTMVQRLVVLTGAGLSAESGVATFRSQGGLWHNHRLEEVATPEAFARDPELVHRFYNERRRQLPQVAPNAAHHALAELAEWWPGSFLLVTQNVDDLQERALEKRNVGSDFKLIHMHGELTKVRCLECSAVLTWHTDVTTDTVCPTCHTVGTLRPHIVWFGEVPFSMPWIMQSLKKCDLFVAIGTSGQVYPAAGFAAVVREYRRGKSLEMNLEASAVSEDFQEVRRGPATELVPAWVAKLRCDTTDGTDGTDVGDHG